MLVAGAAMLLALAAVAAAARLPILPVSHTSGAAEAHDDGFPAASLDDLYKELSHTEHDALPFDGEDDRLDMGAQAAPRFEELHQLPAATNAAATTAAAAATTAGAATTAAATTTAAVTTTAAATTAAATTVAAATTAPAAVTTAGSAASSPGV